MIKLIGRLFFLLLCSQVYGQTAEYSKIYYKPNEPILGEFLIKNYSGGCLVAGDRNLVNINSSGTVIWRKRMTVVATTYIEAACRTNDSAYAIAGHRLSNVFLMKVSKSGDTLWSKGYSFAVSSYVTGVIQTQDSGYAICGWVHIGVPPYERAFVIKTDKSGNTIWSQLIIDSNFGNRASSVRQLSNGCFAVAGSTQLAPAGSFICLLGSGGNMIWNKKLKFNTFGNTKYIALENFNNEVLAAVSTNTGYTYLLRLDTSCNLLLERHFFISPATVSSDYNLSVSLTADKGVLVLNTDGLMRTDSLFNFMWSCTGVGKLRRVIEDDGGGTVILSTGPVPAVPGGSTMQDTMFGLSRLKQFPTANLCFVHDSLDKTIIADSIVILNGNLSLTPAGNYFSVHPNLIVDSITTDSACITEIVGIGEPIEQQVLVQVFPNPGNGNFTITYPENETLVKVEVLDLGGKTVFCPALIQQGNQTMNMDLRGLSSGVYLLKVNLKSQTSVSKLIIGKQH